MCVRDCHKSLFLCVCAVFVFSACTYEVQTLDNSGAMYKPYVVSDETLAQAGLPVVCIQTQNNERILNKEDWISASISISHASEDDWNFEDTAVQIRGRGNYTWKQPKRPYALKFEAKKSVCGMPRHKRWVLIANYCDKSFMKNITAFYLSECLGMDYTVRGQFVNLVLNGNYVGLYWLGEAIKVDSSRVNIDKENDFLLEIDKNYDELWKFHSGIKDFPYMVKNDDAMTEEKVLWLKNRIDQIESILYAGDFVDDSYADYIDIHSFAQLYLVNEILYNRDFLDSRSCYVTLRHDTGILKAGPVWDFDNGGFNPDGTPLIEQDVLYYDALFTIPAFTQKVNELATEISVSAVSQNIDEVKSYLAASAQLDGQRWNYNVFNAFVQNFKEDVTERISYIQNNPF